MNKFDIINKLQEASIHTSKSTDIFIDVNKVLIGEAEKDPDNADIGIIETITNLATEAQELTQKILEFTNKLLLS